TLTTLAATGQDRFHELFRPLTPGFVSVEAGDLDAVKAAAAAARPAAVMIECIQGEGGVIPLDPAYVRALRAWTEDNDVLLLVDEVQTGNGRTGKLYAYMNYGVRPDVVSTAKGLAGGLPLGATLLGEKVKDVFGPGDHGSTFGGNPVCCAAALSVLSRLDDALLDGVARKGRRLVERFTGAAGIRSVSGMGLMLGLATERPAGEVVSELIGRGVLCLTAKDKVRLLPALNIPDDLLERAAGTILDVCAGR
ncbi:MAG: aminotransferase class III-fold pyridoxal phosphate-dependent enzyme, partial [Oscillospiraceae bacterium]|nr:aminotransferase class III-fold pyridoxal phosphate-dependent enzyme [Oscillospiraceae bacterium]